MRSLRRVFDSIILLIHRVNAMYHHTVLLVTGVYLEVEILQSHTQNRSLKGFYMGFADYFPKRAQVLLQYF